MGLHANAHHGHLAYVGVHIEGVVAQHFLLVEQCVLNLLEADSGTVKEMSAVPTDAPACTIMSTFTPAVASSVNTLAAIPGSFGTPRTVASARNDRGQCRKSPVLGAQVREQVAHGFRFFFSHVLPCLA